MPVQDADVLKTMHQIGFAIDHVVIKDEILYTEMNGYELNILHDEGIHFDVHEEDMEKWYREKLAADPVFQSMQISDPDVPENFKLGSMGGHLTLDEVIEELDLMHEYYPDLITEKFSIGQSIEGRDIWTVWIGTDLEETKPQAYYNSLIHAREPMSMMNLVYYMWWLLENYETDETAAFLIDNRHMAFTLVLNPDGYEYNRQSSPNGGGMHRKNRRDVGSSNKGVDLNRNFGPANFWDHPNGGSSLNPNFETYRGEGPFSEPETEALRNFVLDNDFRTVHNYHNYSNLLIYPYGVLQRETIDAHVFTSYAIEMTAENDYEYGTDIETVGYNTRGAADDWFYGYEYGNPRNRVNAISFTPEVGGLADGDGSAWGAFWARAERIVPLSQENLLSNQLLAQYAGPELRYYDTEVPQISETEAGIGGETQISFSFYAAELYNYGRSDMDIDLVLQTDSEHITFVRDTVNVSIPIDEHFTGESGSFIISVDEFIEEGEEIPVTLHLTAPYMYQQLSWDYTLTASGSLVSAHNEPELPQRLTVSENYPNPFNPQTTIQFTLPEPEQVSVEVFDSMGRSVGVIVNEMLESGEHRIDFDASGLSSGIYFYRVQAAGQSVVKKMTLVK